MPEASGYGQFCPVSMAAEILCSRWTVVLLREMLCGSTRFNDLRRGLPTVHVQWSEATAILAGDALQSLAFGLFADERIGAALRDVGIGRRRQRSAAGHAWADVLRQRGGRDEELQRPPFRYHRRQLPNVGGRSARIHRRRAGRARPFAFLPGFEHVGDCRCKGTGVIRACLCNLGWIPWRGTSKSIHTRRMPGGRKRRRLRCRYAALSRRTRVVPRARSHRSPTRDLDGRHMVAAPRREPNDPSRLQPLLHRASPLPDHWRSRSALGNLRTG